MKFYTYLHCKPDGSPFYVGKGCGKRAHQINVGRNRHHQNTVAKYGEASIGVFVFQCESEAQALVDEAQQIAQLRRDGFILANLCGGGGGLSNPSGETRAKLSAARKTRITKAETRERLRLASLGVPRGKYKKESKRRVTFGTTRAGHSSTTRLKMSEAANKVWAARRMNGGT